MRLLENIFQSICSCILPSACIMCDQFQSELLCAECTSQLTTEAMVNYECCRQCGVTIFAEELQHQRCVNCLTHPPHFDETYCLDRYDGRLQNALHQLKYQRRLSYAHGLAFAWNQVIDQNEAVTSADYLLPVPLSREKLFLRGFNQSWEVTRRIHCRGHIQKNPWILKRNHHTENQANENKVARYQAIRGMFYIHPSFQAQIANKTIIVFDDVMTSGATLNEIARVLKENGVARVINWVLLRTLRPR